MNKRLVTEYVLTKTDVLVIREISNLAISNYVDDDFDKKNFNILTNETVYTEKQFTDTFRFLIITLQRIQDRIANLKKEYPLDSLVDEANHSSIVIRPKEFVKMLISNYEMQIAGIERIKNILSTEVEPDEDDE